MLQQRELHRAVKRIAREESDRADAGTRLSELTALFQVSTTLQLQLTVRERGYLVRIMENVEAYDVFLRGAAYYTRGTREANAQARQLFEHAVALDPTYAEAYAFLANTYREEWIHRYNQDPQALERAFELVQKALALDDAERPSLTALSDTILAVRNPEP